MKNPDLNDLHAFAVLGRVGGLAAAARALGTSPATLSRRMTALEEAVGRRLVDRRPSGYALTAAGRAFLTRLEPFSTACADLAHDLARDPARPEVRVSAGSWTMRWLAARIDRLHRPDDRFAPVFIEAQSRLDLRHREIDIGLRDRAPVEDGLAGRRLATVAFAPYRARGSTVEGWIGPPPAPGATPSARWLHAHHGGEIALYATAPRTLLDLALAGRGRIVLPCFAGDCEPGLERAGGLIDALTHSQWIVLHAESRKRPETRRLADRLIRLIRSEAGLYAGAAPRLRNRDAASFD